MSSPSNPENTTKLPEVEPKPETAEEVLDPAPAEAADAPPATELPTPEPSAADQTPGEPAPELLIEAAEPQAQAAPDLYAVEPSAPPAPAAPSLDLPSLDLPHTGDYTENVARASYGQPQPQQAPTAPAYQTPYAVPEPPAQPQYGQPQYGQPQFGQQQPQFGQQQPQYGQQLAYPSGDQLGAADETTWSSAAHWSAILASFVGLGFLGPLLVLLIQGPKSARVRRNAVESLNFEITFIIAMVISVILIFLLIGIVTTILIPLAWLILRILAAVQTSGGQDYRYPVNIRLVK